MNVYRSTRWLPLLALATLGLAASQPAAPRPAITGLHHVAFRTSDVPGARAFYGDVLGLRALNGAAATRLRFPVGHRQRIVIEPGLAPDSEERLSHVAFETPDLDALAAHLKAKGLEVLRPPDGCEERAVRVLDPDGHAIEFVEARWPPARPTDGQGPALSTRLLHAGLTIRDETRAHAFYRDALGFSEIWRGGRTAGVTQWVNMRVPDGTDYLEYMLISEPPDRRQRGVLHHLCLVVPDVQAAFEEAARRSAVLKRPWAGGPNIGINGRWQLNMYDPDGTRVELMEPFTVR
jgi:lactoylglutathione lyase